MDGVNSIGGIFFLAGAAGSGKSTIARGIVERLPSAILLDKDVVNYSFLHRSAPDFSEGLAVRATPFGDCVVLPPSGALYDEHVRMQSYILLVELARVNASLGKIVIVDSLFPNQFVDGTVERILESLNGVPSGVVYSCAPGKVLRERLEVRIRDSEWYKTRDGGKIASDASWSAELGRNPLVPEGLKVLPHVIIDTTHDKNVCISSGLEYVCSRMGLSIERYK